MMTAFDKEPCDSDNPYEPPPPGTLLLIKQREELQPGKHLGIASLICGVFPLVYTTIIVVLIETGFAGIEPKSFVVEVLNIFTLLFVCVGIILGYKGRKTQGRCYALIGLWLSIVFFVFLVLYPLLLYTCSCVFVLA